jgi:TIR domain
VAGYQYDVFVSYRRTGNVRDWVRNHLYPRLEDALADEMDRPPELFVDVTGIEAGDRWPVQLESALQRSRLLLAVWSPPYFTSPWCLAEWRTMLRRQELLGIGGPQAPGSLVYPIRFSDGDSFPPDARGIQQEMIFTPWRYPYPQFAQSPKYLDFHDAVVELAVRLTSRLEHSPPWQDDWPSEFPEPAAQRPAALPRL